MFIGEVILCIAMHTPVVDGNPCNPMEPVLALEAPGGPFETEAECHIAVNHLRTMVQQHPQYTIPLLIMKFQKRGLKIDQSRVPAIGMRCYDSKKDAKVGDAEQGERLRRGLQTVTNKRAWSV